MNIVSSCVLYEAQTKISVLIYACPKLCDWLVNIWTANQDDLKPGQHKFMLFLLLVRLVPAKRINITFISLMQDKREDKKKTTTFWL